MKRTFTREFKRQVASQALTGEKGMAQLCREYGLCQTLVRRWRDQYQQLGEAAWPDSIHPIEASELDPEGRIAELEAALGRAHLENELLRRALKKGGLLPGRNGR
jgi:transposase-like protein